MTMIIMHSGLHYRYFSRTEWCSRRGIRSEAGDLQFPWQSLSSFHGSEEGREARDRKREQLWHEFFADPSQWWDNRLTKKNAKQPDFKHKHTQETLWINSSWNPASVKERIGNLDSIAHIKQRNPSCNVGEIEVAQNLCKEGRLKDAIHFIECMAHRISVENAPKATYICLLKECTKKKMLTEGKRVHALIVQSNCESSILLANNLIHMYSRCGSLQDACMVFSAMPLHDIFSWTTIISAYVGCGKCEEAFNLYKEMQKSSIPPDSILCTVILKACARTAALETGKQIHFLILEKGIHLDIVLQNTLVDMYAKCGCLENARDLFNKMSKRDVVSWNAMIAGYAQNGLGIEAIALYKQMKQEGLDANRVTFLCILKACTSIGALEQGKQIHSLILGKGFHLDIVLQNTLVDMYAKCGCLDNARDLFNKMSKRDVVSWNAMIVGHVQNGLGMEAIALYKQMKQERVEANGITFVCVLKACASIGGLEQGKQIHFLILEKGFHLDIVVQNALIDMYAKCGCVDNARYLFNKMRKRDVVSWNAMIGGYAQNGLGMQAIALYKKMKQEGVEADSVTFLCALKACATIGALEQGKQIHSLILEKGIHLDIVIQSALVDMYAKCRCLENARDFFNKMSIRNVVSWNAMILGYAQNGLGMEAIALYKQMKQEGVEANGVTFVCVLKACASIGALEHGKQIHSLILEKGFHLDIVVQNALVDMYAKCGCLDNARALFNKMSKRDVISWNAMITGYAQNGLAMEAISLYKKMNQEGVEADGITFVCVLKACASIGALEQGKQIHSLILEKGVHLDIVVQSALVDMYAKCGCLDNARDLFNKMSKRDAVSWNAMIAGYAQNGLGMEAIALYKQMKQEGMEANGVQPDDITYTCVLSTCSHFGLVNEGFHVFDFLCRYSGVIPTLKHYACMVDLLGRAGLLVEAKDFIRKMPIQPDRGVWMSLLGAARNSGNLEIGQHAFYNIVKLDPQNAAPYLLLIEIFARVGRMDKVAEIRKMMMDRGLKKIHECSWIEVDHQMHAFVVGDESHPQSQQIWTRLTTLLGLMRKEGYMPDLSSVPEAVSEEEKEILLCKHSEKLAVAFGLIRMPSWVPLRIKKNLRVCHDCHNATKIISKITRREIYVMDENLLHHFKDGVCSCRDYW